MSTHDAVKDRPEKGPKHVTIHIDKETFKVEGESITAEELRALPNPDIGADRDLYLETHGRGDDTLIQAGMSVPLDEGMHFFTAPAAITPGCAA
jgi:Multiubiquitin